MVDNDLGQDLCIFLVAKIPYTYKFPSVHQYVSYVLNSLATNGGCYPCYCLERWMRGCPAAEAGKKSHPFACIPFSHGPRDIAIQYIFN